MVGLFSAWAECVLGVVWAYYDYLKLLREYSGGEISVESSYLYWPY